MGYNDSLSRDLSSRISQLKVKFPMEIIVYFKVFEIQYFLHMLRIGLKMEYFYTLAPIKIRDSHVSGTSLLPDIGLSCLMKSMLA